MTNLDKTFGVMHIQGNYNLVNEQALDVWLGKQYIFIIAGEYDDIIVDRSTHRYPLEFDISPGAKLYCPQDKKIYGTITLGKGVGNGFETNLYTYTNLLHAFLCIFITHNPKLIDDLWLKLNQRFFLEEL